MKEIKSVHIVMDERQNPRSPAVGPSAAKGILELAFYCLRDQDADSAEQNRFLELGKPSPYDGEQSKSNKNKRRSEED